MTQAANNGSSEHPAALFIAALFGPTTEQPVFFQSLANNASDQDEARYKPQLLTRDIAPIGRFITRHDRARRGLFFCVATVAKDASTRSKETVRETIGLHADIDFKSVLEDEPTIRARLDTLRCQPSVIVRSGGGLHLYWLFRESIDTQVYREPIEIALRRLAEIIAGDLAVCEVSHLMRLPGTHNSKRGDMRKVVCETLDGPRYELDELEEWLSEQQPILTRKTVAAAGRPAACVAPIDDNPFAAFARQTGERFGYKPRLDIDAMLAAMTDGNIHNSQIRVAASLISTGHSREQTHQILMEATRLSVGDKDWDWHLESEKYVKEAVESAIRKYSPKDPVVSREAEKPPSSDAPGDDNVVNFGDAKTHRKPRQTIKDGDKVDHIDIGTLFLESLKTAGQAVMFTEKGSYCYEEGLWRLLDDKSLKAWLDSRLESCVRLTKAKSNNKIIGEARGWIIRHPELQKKNIQFDAHGCVPTQSGLIDPQSGSVISYRPDHYCTWRVPFAYDPQAVCPYWLQMLADVFADRPEAVQREYITLVQDWMGMGLVEAKAKALSCILFFQGGTDYGKSEIINVLAGIFGGRRNTTPIDMLDKTHGLMAFISRSPWVLPEAFEQGKWHFSSVTKALASGEPIQINMKNGGIFDHTFTGPIIWGANNDPQFKEATAAITNRLLIVPCRRKFDPLDPVGVAIIARAAGLEKPSQLILRDEMPGVLAWAVQGLIRAKARGYFLRPEESRIAAENVRRDTNIVVGFVADCVTFDPDGIVSVPDFAAAFASWWAEGKGNERGVPGSESVSKALKSLAEPRIAFDLKDNSRRYYAGVRLNDEGKRYWRNAVTSEAFVFQSRKASTTASDGDPNRFIPPSWSGKRVVKAMRAAHAKSVTVSGDSFPGDVPLSGDSEKLSPQLSPQLSSTQATDPSEDIPF